MARQVTPHKGVLRWRKAVVFWPFVITRGRILVDVCPCPLFFFLFLLHAAQPDRLIRLWLKGGHPELSYCSCQYCDFFPIGRYIMAGDHDAMQRPTEEQLDSIVVRNVDA